MWQSFAPEGAQQGWGGRIADLLVSANQSPVFTALSTGGNAVFLTGNQVLQYQVNPSGPVRLDTGDLFGSTTASAALRRVVGGGGGNDYQREYARVTQRALDNAAVLQAALAGTAVNGLPSSPITLPNGSSLNLSHDSLAQQLRLVAQMVAAAPSLGMRRQVFMVSMGGFDTHAYQMRDQPLLMARVAQSVGWFMSALGSLGMQNNVTLFSASDFGRTLTTNGQGSDHGWGSHHFVAGGAVRGRQIYGRVPRAVLGSTDDVGSGRLLPSTSVTELAATLGRWMGLSSTELTQVLPNLGNFGSAGLGFI
jgi:uncharacterized protein (DUF1501 family)